MTRFTRAKGSRLSNERVPEEATFLDELEDSKEEKDETPKKGIKRKLSVSVSKTDKVTNGKKNGNKVKKYDELTEEEKKKVDKKREKNAKQIEKRNLLKKEKNQSIQNDGDKKKKILKPKDNKELKTKKRLDNDFMLHINGMDIKVTKFEGFPVKYEDAERLKKLRKDMVSKGIPKSEIETAIKLERRKAEKALAREKKKTCFNCRKSGHVLSDCPNLNKTDDQETIASGVCFKCGSTEHNHFECKVVKNDNYKFATCFICKEQGHISRQCPDNKKGLYPKGGACKVCGDVTHLKRDCPNHQAQQELLNVQDVNAKKNDKIKILSNKVIKV